MKKLVHALVWVGLAGTPAMAVAAETSAHEVTGNVSLNTDYRYRGVSQTFKGPAIQGGFDYAHSSGAYLGAWASNVDSEFLNGANVELDVYGGYSGTVSDDLSYNVGGLYYYYPGQFSGTDKINTFEVYAGGTWKWLNVKYSHATTKFFGVDDSKNAYYLEANVTVPLPMDIDLGLHVGHQEVKGANGFDYNDWKVGLSKEIGGFNVGLAYVDTDFNKADGSFTRSDGKTRNLAGATVVLSVGKSF
ncbi:MAG: hypothetical protein B7X93_10280 [Hydrogenophilales bacterium 17-61-9]|nr:MAG: hypothetical protein B7X93_10280 [Hydrogenophilales bacterium 17-61-9]